MKIDVLILLETKNFEELSQEERVAVLNEMSEAAYQQERKLILNALIMAEDEMSHLEPDPKILLMSQQKMKRKKKAGAALIFQHKMPTWAAIAACLLLFFGLWGFYGLNYPKSENMVVTETIYDTIYADKIITEQIQHTDTVVQYVYVEHQPEINIEEVVHTKELMIEEPSYDNLYFPQDQYCNMMSCYEAKKGNSAANDAWLKLIQGGI